MRTALISKIAAVAVCASLSFCSLSACGPKEVALDKEAILNFKAPEQDEEIAVITIKDYGDVKIKLFPEQCSKGVENFKTLIQNGYYDELIFHRVIDSFMIQGGDPTGTGGGGDDCWNDGGFAQTISPNLHHFAGAVAYAVAPQVKLNGSQFYIVTGSQADATTIQQIGQYYQKTFSSTVTNLYNAFGGAPHLDGDYEIFGQVFSGLEYCLDIQKVKTDASDKPTKQVVIEKAQIVKYDGSGVNYLNYKGEPTVADVPNTK